MLSPWPSQCSAMSQLSNSWTKEDKRPVCIGCLCLHILCLFSIGYNKRLCVLWVRGGVSFIFLGRKHGVNFYEKLGYLKSIFLAYKELSCSENWTEVFVII